jgi:hypothetical protein
MKNPVLWNGTLVEPLELDETGRWVTVRDGYGNKYLAPADELQMLKRYSVPQVK